MSFGDYECPNCGADLELQQGFDPDKGYWTCTVCGQQLFGDDEDEASSSRRFPGVVWHCDGCDAVLNNQDGFDDWDSTWICTECGHLNYIDESEIGNGPGRSSDGSLLGNIASILGNVADMAGVVSAVAATMRDDEDEPPQSRRCDSDTDGGDDDAVEHEGKAADKSAKDADKATHERESVPKASSKANSKTGLKTLVLAYALILILLLAAVFHPSEFGVALKETGDALIAWGALLFKLLMSAVDGISGCFK